MTRRSDQIFFYTLRVIALTVICIFASLVWQLYGLSAAALNEFGLDFFSQNVWNPVLDKYGALAFIWGTVASSIIALIIAVPISVGTALLLTEVAPRWVRQPIGFLVEMLAAIPSVVYGLWGIFVLAPIVRNFIQPPLAKYFGDWTIFSGPPFGLGLLTAGIILAIMITPTIAAITREVFSAIPKIQREGALALGATRWEAIRLAVLKPGMPGIFSAVVLGLGRALGETMAVTMVIGNRSDISMSLFKPAATMASVIANEYSEAGSDLHLSALSAVGLTLLAMSLVVYLIARSIVRLGFRKAAR